MQEQNNLLILFNIERACIVTKMMSITVYTQNMIVKYRNMMVYLIKLYVFDVHHCGKAKNVYIEIVMRKKHGNMTLLKNGRNFRQKSLE